MERLIEIFDSSEFRDMLGQKGHSDLETEMQSLAGDIDKDGHLRDPSKWGISILADGSKSDDNKSTVEPGYDGKSIKRRKPGKLDIESEFKFWQDIASGGWDVPTDSKKSAVAGRWERACEEDPSLKQKYDAISGERVRSRKQEFRATWAQLEFKKAEA
eukprot:268968-Pyramimonas_sp.AAC.1